MMKKLQPSLIKLSFNKKKVIIKKKKKSILHRVKHFYFLSDLVLIRLKVINK